MVFFAFQFLERDLNDIQEPPVDLLVHMRIDTEAGIFSIQLLKCAKQSVPNAQYITIIAIGIRQPVMVVHMVQVGSDEYQTNKFIGPVWQSKLCMGDDIRERLEYLPDDKYAD